MKEEGRFIVSSIIEEVGEENVSYSDNSLYNITSFGTDITFREIISMYEEGDIVKPEMQRNYVWTKKEASRFIDSILLGLPVPSIFLGKAPDAKLLIVDGYQRITTVCDYIKGVFSGDNSVFKLTKADNIHPNWRGKAYIELTDAQKRMIRLYTIHAIVFEQKQPQNDTGMYQVFERINTGGRTLKPQEIRNCVYHGDYNNMLSALNRNSDWRAILGTEEPDSRMADIELVLRFFAFNAFKDNNTHMKQINLVKYLNEYMASQNKLNHQRQNDEKLFVDIMRFLNRNLGIRSFRTCKMNKTGHVVWSKKVNPVVMDAVTTATSIAAERFGLDNVDTNSFSGQYMRLLLDESFISVTKTRTTNVENIRARVHIAADYLFGIKL